MDKTFKIGAFPFRLITPEDITPPENFLLFETDEAPVYTYQMVMADEISQNVGTILARRPDLLVFQTEAGEGRLIASRGETGLYAAYREEAPDFARITVTPNARLLLTLDPGFLSPFAMERQMIQRDSLILHCAYIVHEGEAILFSAPSETGKSTQAGLWEQYRNARTVNGDRSLLRKIHNRWHACGWPVCGSSGQCALADTPIRAIVMLRQGKENAVIRLSPLQGFSQLYAQITVNQWNPKFAESSMTLLEDLISAVPVFQLTCDISQNAVDTLFCALYD